MNLRRKVIATAMSVAMIFSTATSASVMAVGDTVVNSKPKAPEKSEAVVTINESTVSRVEKNAAQPAKAGVLINDIKDKATYEEALRTVLDNYYSSGASENASKLDSVVDSRGDVIFENYINAENERKTEPIELGYMPGEVLAVTKAGLKDEEIPDIINDERMSVEQVLPYTDDRKLVKISISLEDTVDNAIAKLEANENIEFIEKDQVYTNEYSVGDYIDDTGFENLYHLELIKSVDAWKLLAKTDHEKVKVAVIDTGADIEHEDIKNVINKDLSVRISADGIVCPLKNDSDAHGTHVSGIIAAEANNGVGIAGVGSAFDNSAIDLIGIGCDVGYAGIFSTMSVYRAVKYAVENGARVINMSLGGRGDYKNIFQTAVTLAVNSGCVVVCAAGNDGSTDPHYPSDCEGAISVIALDETGNARADFSNYGSTKNKISAPGAPVYSTIPDNAYERFQGTSMASPVVAAVAGMVLSVNPKLTVEEVKDIIYSTADDINGGGYDDDFGYGRVNAYEAVKKAIGYQSVATPVAIKLSNSKIELAKGSTAKLSGTVTPQNAVQTVTYHSENEGIATINTNGVITAKSSGTTSIVACTVNNIITRCEVTVKDAGNTKLQKPTADTVQTGDSTGATIKWDKVENADYYQIYASEEEDTGYTYIGSTYNTTYSIDMFDLYAIPASTVYFLKVKAVASDNSVSDSEFSDRIAYVYTGQEPYLNAEIIAEEGYGTGLFVHWGAIVSSELYRVNTDTNESVLLKTFGENRKDNYYYDNKGELEEGANYKYVLKLFNTYKGVKYYGFQSEFSFKYSVDDPVIENCGEPHINGIKYDNNMISISMLLDDERILNRVYVSNDNGKSWFEDSTLIGSRDEYTDYTLYEVKLKPETKYLVRYKYYETGLTAGLYRNCSKYSNIVALTTPPIIEAPVLSVTRNNNNQPVLSWTGGDVNEGFYTIYRRDEGSSDWKMLWTYVREYEFTDRKVNDNQIYYYKVVYSDSTADVIFDVDSSIKTEALNHQSEESNIVRYRMDTPAKEISSAEVTKIDDIVYKGEVELPAFTVTYKGKKLRKNIDYVAYSSNNDKVGRASIRITGIGEYTGEKVVFFNILQPENEKPITYTVTYKDYDGTILSTQKVVKYADAVPPSAPKRSGYMFTGWSSNGNNIIDNTTITANYEKINEKIYTVTFVDKDNKVISQQKVELAGKATPPSAPVYAGYEFTHWNHSDYTNVTNNMVVKAKYRATRFEAGNGTENDPYVISTPEQLDYFSYVINNENAKYASAHYVLANSIYYNDITDYETWGQSDITGDLTHPENIWVPAGVEVDDGGVQNCFRGTFDGKGNSIYGLYVYDLSKNYIGFIGNAQNAVIRNIGIENSYLGTKGNYVGALVGRFSSLVGSSELYCCYARDNNIIGDSFVGGLVGEIITINATAETRITNCYTDNSYVKSPSGNHLGGFSGVIHSNGSYTVVQRCYSSNYIEFMGDNPVAGWFSGDIVKAENSLITVWGCYCIDYGYGTDYNSHDPFEGIAVEGVEIERIYADDFLNADFTHLLEYTDDEGVANNCDAVWVFNEEDVPRLYIENGKYLAEFYMQNELCYFVVLKEGEKLNAPYLDTDYGYTATGWSAEVPEYMPANNLTFFNMLKQNSYTVEFYYNNRLIETKTYYENDEVQPPVIEGENVIWRDLPAVMPNQNVKVYGVNYMLGDVNNDSDVTVADVLMVMKHTINPYTLNAQQLMIADVDFNGIVDVRDVLIMQRYIIGMITKF
ncbi:MAG: S8 family serine peptidase [Acutalibacteraceae bacterium]|nr:S8 family serine peptidase [Acutalibacteraceae bacterium]